MHIPDGFLDPWICALFYLLAAAFLGLALRRGRIVMRDEHVPLLATLTAAVFAAQMINWPVGPGGTTAHFVGCGLLAIFLGIGGAVTSMTVVLAIQCLFGDGGVTALGANIWNMGIVGAICGWALYAGVSRVLGNTPQAKVAGAFAAGWLGITAAAFFCGLQIGISPRFPYGLPISVPIMTGLHCLLGLIEGLITAGIVSYTLKARPDLLELPKIGL